MALNPYATRETRTDPQRADTPISVAPTYVVPQMGAYGAPTLDEGAPYTKEFGWGPKLRTSPTEIPSAQRLKTIPRWDFRPDPVRPPEEGFYDNRDADTEQRHSVESIDADGWSTPAGINPGDKRWADNPRRTPPPEPRLTNRMAPRSYTFTRPFDQHAARQFNGEHFSMADHRRNYEILGMSPVRTMRNTYRIEPTPWDENIVDMPPSDNNADGLPSARLRGVELSYPQRTWRL